MKIIAITNRHLCREDFFLQIENICRKENLYALILREKDLTDKNYTEYAVKCNNICKKYNVLFFINSKINIAEKLSISNIQISFTDFLKNKNKLNNFDHIAVSVHSLEEAKIIENNKLSAHLLSNPFTLSLIVGHIFKTNSKKDIPPRGIDFLKEICDNVSLPVFAIGGINCKTIDQLKGLNIEGVCMMSELMQK